MLEISFSFRNNTYFDFSLTKIFYLPNPRNEKTKQESCIDFEFKI